VVNASGQIYHRVSGAWQLVSGPAASDIGVGANGAVWIIGKDSSIQQYSGSGWTAVGGAAVDIAVGADGQPWVVNASGQIYHRVSGAWQLVSGPAASDIGVH